MPSTRGLDARTLRRSLLRGALGLLAALVPSLLAHRFVAVPPCVALVLIPFTLVELGWDSPRANRLFAVATLLCAAAVVNGVYLEGVVHGGSIAAGLAAVSRNVGLASSVILAAAIVALIAQSLALGFALSVEIVEVDRRPAVDPIIFGPVLVGLEVAVLILFFQKPAAAPVAGFVFTLIAMTVAFAVAVLVRGTCLAADAIESRVWPELAT